MGAGVFSAGGIPDVAEIERRAFFYDSIAAQAYVADPYHNTHVPQVDAALAQRDDHNHDTVQRLDAIIRVGSYGVGLCVAHGQGLPKDGLHYLIRVNEDPYEEKVTKILELLLPGQMVEIGGAKSHAPELGSEGHFLEMAMSDEGIITGAIRPTYRSDWQGGDIRQPMTMLLAERDPHPADSRAIVNPLINEVRTWEVSSAYLRRLVAQEVKDLNINPAEVLGMGMLVKGLGQKKQKEGVESTVGVDEKAISPTGKPALIRRARLAAKRAERRKNRMFRWGSALNLRLDKEFVDF